MMRQLIIAAVLFSAGTIATGQVYTTVDAKTLTPAQVTALGEAVFRRRPYLPPGQPASVELAQDGKPFDLGFVKAFNLLNLKAIHITASDGLMPRAGGTAKEGPFVSFSAVHIHDFAVGTMRKTTEGLHIDALKIDSTGNPGERTDVTVENGTVTDCGPGVMPTHIKDGGHFGTVILRNMRYTNNTHPVMLGGNGGTFKAIIIDSCPGIHVALQGAPGCMPSVIVKNSPGAVVQNSDEGTGKTPEAVVVFDNASGGIIVAGPTTAPVVNQPHDTVAIPDDFTFVELFRSKHDPIYLVSDARGTIHLAGMYSRDLLFSTTVKNPGDYWKSEYDALNTAATAKIAALQADVDAQAAQLAAWNKWATTAPKK